MLTFIKPKISKSHALQMCVTNLLEKINLKIFWDKFDGSKAHKNTIQNKSIKMILTSRILMTQGWVIWFLSMLNKIEKNITKIQFV